MEKQGRITAVCGNNFKDVNITALQQINPTDLEVENIIILPDRSSLAMEKEIFSTLAINSTMNINIMGISRFAKSIFKNLKAEFEFLSKKESVMLVRIAMKNLKGKLISFKGALDLGLCTEVFEALSQFKSNQIGLDDITEAQKLLPMFSAERLADLKLILEEYDRLLGEKLDSTKMLEVLENYLEKKDFDKTNIFFLNYDALTKQGYSILKALAKTKANIFVGALVPDNSPNRFVFENDIFDKLKTLENQGVEISILRAGNTLGVENQHIGKFLFVKRGFLLRCLLFSDAVLFFLF